MKTTEYKGIDYGLGQANIDTEKQIRFGVIGQNAQSLNCDAVQDIWQNGRDLSFEAYQEEAKNAIRSALSDYLSDIKWGEEKESKLDRAVNDAFDAVEQELSDVYECNGTAKMLYEHDGYKIETTETELVILRSPFFTHAQFCSPCFPGAGNLETHCADGPKTYCLGQEWFEDEKAPYPIYSVETGEEVKPLPF